ncbi:MAG TPA: tripartite tricarboxylate transporter substrate binding protein [Xanthobacteraceae bacterium]|jgi:tripartite-type tricarboxylate transporter receptor subunit TctC|nr:tripartite tricarboxylate transporter substrate binding protein [Xanthobacteraceae bacterium]
MKYRSRVSDFLTGLAATIAAVACLTSATMTAQSEAGYPSRPVQLIIAYGAGSAGDVSMRILAEHLGAKIGQPIVVINKPGAGGVAAAQAAAASAPDGYTLMLNGNSYTISAALFKSLPYNILTDFASVSTVASFDMLILVKAGSQFHTVQDIVAYAKANPGKLNVGTLAPGTTQFLAAYLFKIITGADLTPVPFRTSPDMATALLRGDVDVALEFYAPMQALIIDKKVVAVAAAGSKRQYFVPDVPTTAESGIPKFDVSSWNAISVPAGTPKPIIDMLSKATIEVLEAPDVQEAAHRLGLEMHGSTPEALTARLKGDIAKWTDVVEKANIPKMD